MILLILGTWCPPPFLIPTDNPEDDLDSFKFLQLMKSHDYYSIVMIRWEKLLNDKTFLSIISLGALGNIIEYEIHNQLHNRLGKHSNGSTTKDPAKRPKPLERDLF